MRCDSRFFDLKKMPSIDLNKSILEKLAMESTALGLTVTGVQKKLSLHLSDEDPSRLTLVDYPAGYILKPQTDEFEQLPEAEDLVMDIAEMMGVNVVPHGLIEAGGETAYITRRVDRKGDALFAMEDFCQLSGRLTQDKYGGSYEQCAKLIRKYSSMIGFDLSEFFLRLIVCFVTGNSDMHLKNFSLIERSPKGRDFVLSPAYDLLPVNIIMPEDKEETALTLNGKRARLRKKDFMVLADNAGINARSVEHMIKKVVSKENEAIDMCISSELNDELKDSMIALIRERTARLA